MFVADIVNGGDTPTRPRWLLARMPTRRSASSWMLPGSDPNLSEVTIVNSSSARALPPPAGREKCGVDAAAVPLAVAQGHSCIFVSRTAALQDFSSYLWMGWCINAAPNVLHGHLAGDIQLSIKTAFPQASERTISPMASDFETFLQLEDLAVIQRYSVTAMVALLVWHYLTTLDKEIALFWKRKLTGACGLFFAARYLGLVTNVLDNNLWPSPASYTACAASIYIFYVTYILQYAAWAIFSSLRVHALREQWAWSIIVLILSLVPVGTNMDPGLGCNTFIPLSDHQYNGILIATRSCLALADAIVVAITWATTYRFRNTNAVLGTTTSLFSVMFRDAINLTDLPKISKVSNPLLGPTASVVTLYVSPLTALIVTQFLIDIHDAAATSTPNRPSHWSVGTLQFAGAEVLQGSSETPEDDNDVLGPGESA
ncbi:hypothetical protein BV20DRAFT_978697 [Pilatotrama ljubarskyi]|nr:hypothetical protein BV20DRAFT_978697 [Pilatotrama ljubarskyi]